MQTKALLGILTITLGLVVQVQAQSFLTNGLLAYYPFNTDANDASGNGNNGTAINGVSYVPDQFHGSVAYFNGNAQYISLPNSISNYEDLSVTFWVKTSASNPNAFNGGIFVVSRDITGAAYDWNICLGQGRKIQFHTGTPTNDSIVLVPSNDIGSNEWVHVACVADSIGQVKNVFVDGQEAASTNWTPDAFANDYVPIFVGASTVNPGLHTYFTGEMSDLRIYNRALSDSEVQQLYAYESAPCLPHGATATATMVDGFVVAVNFTDGGCGYTNTPLVLIEGGGGVGATATAVVSNGVVVGITITDAGIGYTSTPAIYIDFPITITSQPQSLIVNAYDTASFNVTTSGGSGPVSYQWSLNDTNIAAATSSTLTVSNVTQSNLGTYAVAVTDYFGSQSSSNATLSMYPSIVTPFAGAVEYWGTNATFSVEAWGSEPLTYQWFDNGAAIQNATNETLTLSSIQFTDAGLYTVVVGNSFGSVTNPPEQVVVDPAGVSIGLYPGVTISGVVGNNYIIQRTPNLGDTNSWVTTANVTLTQPVQLWVDTNINASLPANPQNYYQVLPGQ